LSITAVSYPAPAMIIIYSVVGITHDLFYLRMPRKTTKKNASKTNGKKTPPIGVSQGAKHDLISFIAVTGAALEADPRLSHR
jgi:hypothetical protein